MSSPASSSHPHERIQTWKERWDSGQTGFHKTEINQMLEKYLNKLINGNKDCRIFLPLCGKSVEMKWLANQGLTVIGVEGIQKAIEQFFQEQETENAVEDVPSIGENAKLFKSKDGRIRIYCCDIMNFSSAVEGTVDAIWDRGSLVAIRREDLQQYVQVIKGMLRLNGRMLLEVVEYDISIMADEAAQFRPPPPFPMYESELKLLFEPECRVEFVDRYREKIRKKDIMAAIYQIVKIHSDER